MRVLGTEHRFSQPIQAAADIAKAVDDGLTTPKVIADKFPVYAGRTAGEHRMVHDNLLWSSEYFHSSGHVDERKRAHILAVLNKDVDSSQRHVFVEVPYRRNDNICQLFVTRVDKLGTQQQLRDAREERSRRLLRKRG